MAGEPGSERETAGYTAVRVKVDYAHAIVYNTKERPWKGVKGKGAIELANAFGSELKRDCMF